MVSSEPASPLIETASPVTISISDSDSQSPSPKAPAAEDEGGRRRDRRKENEGEAQEERGTNPPGLTMAKDKEEDEEPVTRREFNALAEELRKTNSALQEGLQYLRDAFATERKTIQEAHKELAKLREEMGSLQGANKDLERRVDELDSVCKLFRKLMGSCGKAFAFPLMGRMVVEYLNNYGDTMRFPKEEDRRADVARAQKVAERLSLTKKASTALDFLCEEFQKNNTKEDNMFHAPDSPPSDEIFRGLITYAECLEYRGEGEVKLEEMGAHETWANLRTGFSDLHKACKAFEDKSS